MVLSFGVHGQFNTQVKKEPWTQSQLMPVETLANRISKGQTKNLLVLSIGFDDVIAGSTYVGAGRDRAAIEKLKQILKNESKDTEVVLYCGCCPFASCPNVRPAFQTVKDLGFKNLKLLDIPNNIKVNWIDKGYPSK